MFDRYSSLREGAERQARLADVRARANRVSGVAAPRDLLDQPTNHGGLGSIRDRL